VVKEVVLSSLRVSIDFDFYVVPPRRALQINKTLAEEQLVPAAKIHVSWNGPTPSVDYINPELFMLSNEEEEFPEGKNVSDVTNQAVEKAPKVSEEDMMRRMMGKGGLGCLKSSGEKDDSADSQGGKKHPKWFKR